MKILFGSNYGKSVNELESSYLIWIIEKYDGADFNLINECKKELSSRLKLDWSPKSEREFELELSLKLSTHQVDKLLKERELFEKVICMSIICKGNPYTLETYLNYADLLESDINFICKINYERA